MARNFKEMLKKQWDRGNFVCVGLDTDLGKIPLSVRAGDQTNWGAILEFNRQIVGVTKNLAGAYKLNPAFYEAHGEDGWQALKHTVRYINGIAEEVPVILDGKYGDVPHTNAAYAKYAFEELGADAVTVNPYAGGRALWPFLEHDDKGVFVVAFTSNQGGEEFQDKRIPLAVMGSGPAREEFRRFERRIGRELWESDLALSHYVAFRVAEYWNERGNCGIVFGGTCADEDLAFARQIVGAEFPILIPGIGEQGGGIRRNVEAARDAAGKGFLISVSRGIIYASTGRDFAEAARRETENLRDLINRYRTESVTA